MVTSRRRTSWALIVAALLSQPVGGADEAAAKAAAERDARALGWLLQRGLQVLAQPAAPAGQPPVDEQRRQQIDQQAKQMERMFQPLLNSELELIRRTCGGLSPDARRRILAAGREAVSVAARGFTERQFNGRLGQDNFDPRQQIRSAVEQALEPLADPDAFAAYRQEVERRMARLEEAARVAIVARIDRQLELSAKQRQRIESELERTWQAGWSRDLGNRSDMRINNLSPAPDYAAAAIVPHLSPDQAAAWEVWCRAAGSRMLGKSFHWNIDGQGLQQIDPWWGR